MNAIQSIRLPTRAIYSRAGARAISPARVAELAASLAAIGLRTPITVRATGGANVVNPSGGYCIVAGQHRYAAAVDLAWAEIDCFIMDGDAQDAELWEIEENLNREELTPTQAAIAHKRREEILVAKGLVNAKPGPARGVTDKLSATSYSRQAAGSLGVDERTVRRDLARGKKVAPEILAEIEGTPLDKGVVLDRLAAAPAERQREMLDTIRREASPRPVRRADAPLADDDASERQLAALTAAWNRAGPDARAKFLILINSEPRP